MSTASLSICSSVKPGFRLMIFKSYTQTSVNIFLSLENLQAHGGASWNTQYWLCLP